MVTRHFLSVGSRRVHYWRAGQGTPVVLVHSSPANARLLRPEIDHLCERFTVFAFDTPGFGLSDPLPLAEMTVADLADALAETLEAIGMPSCPVYGTHTGAAIALELGVRHPDRVCGLVLDGVPIFTPEEIERNTRTYFRSLPVTDLGGIYAEAWTRFRDQAIWFPWNERRSENLNDYDLSPSKNTHLWVSMYFEAADHYVPAYRAALGYGPRARAAAAELRLPCLFTATDTDMLFSHLDRLPPLRQGQEIRRIGRSSAAKLALIAEGFGLYESDGTAPSSHLDLTTETESKRLFLSVGSGQLHLRHCGDPRSARTILLIHDAPGSSERCEPLLAELAALTEGAVVLAPDLPGQGESAPAGSPDLDSWALLLAEMLDSLGRETCEVIGLGFGSSLAVRFALRHAERATRVTLVGALLPDPAERSELTTRFAPPITIAEDGGQWYRTWLMLRDSLVWWPWYEHRKTNLRKQDMSLSAQDLHRWVLDVMRQRESYGDVIAAALAEDITADIALLAVPVRAIIGGEGALSVYDRQLARLCNARAVQFGQSIAAIATAPD